MELEAYTVNEYMIYIWPIASTYNIYEPDNTMLRMNNKLITHGHT